MKNITPEFAADWVKALAAMPDLHPNQTADTGKYSYQYVDLAHVLRTIRPILTKHNMAVHQTVGNTDLGPVVTTIVTHASGGQMLLGDLALPAGSTAQQAGSAITYARRYSLTAAFGLAVDDDDGAAASKPVKETPPFDDRKWLADRVKIFGKWDDARRKDAFAVAVAELKPGKPMTPQEAQAVFAHMSAVYYQEHPDDDGAPF